MPLYRFSANSSKQKQAQGSGIQKRVQKRVSNVFHDVGNNKLRLSDFDVI